MGQGEVAPAKNGLVNPFDGMADVQQQIVINVASAYGRDAVQINEDLKQTLYWDKSFIGIKRKAICLLIERGFNCQMSFSVCEIAFLRKNSNF